METFAIKRTNVWNYTYGCQVTSCNWEADCQWCWSSNIRTTLVTNTYNRSKQLSKLFELNTKTHLPCTTKTNINVINASMMTPWIGSKFLFNIVFPNTPFRIFAGVANWMFKKTQNIKMFIKFEYSTSVSR